MPTSDAIDTSANARLRVVFAAGGTGGHLYPAIAIADALRNRAEILFIGTADRLETTIVPQAGYELVTISARSVPKEFSFGAIAAAVENVAGIVQALRAIARFRPNVVIATGGYVCVPAVIAAKCIRVFGRAPSLALLEPNAQPGRANRLLSPMVDEVWGAFPEPAESRAKRYVHTGVPIRQSLLHPNNRIEAARRLGLDPSRRTILAVGGSQGARTINEAIAALATRRALPPAWQILHLCGERDYAYMQAEEQATLGDNKVVLFPYLDDMADAYAVSDLVIARAGASTLAEIAALGLPAVLIPYPFAADDHQTLNARAMETQGAAVTIEDRALNADTLWWALRELMEPATLSQMRLAGRSLRSGDPVAAILARVDVLASRNADLKR